jgi:hypothetical protein
MNLDYIRVKWLGRVGCCSGKEVAHEGVVVYLEPSQPNPVRLTRPKGKSADE